MILDKETVIASCKLSKFKDGSFFNLSIENYYKKLIKKKIKKLNYEKKFNYSTNVYSQILPEITKQLNSFYNTSYSKRFWEILIGYWLLRLIQIHKNYYDNFIKLRKKRKIIVTEFNKKIFECNNYSEFNIQTTSSLWHENYISFLSNYFFKKKDITIIRSKYLKKNQSNNQKEYFFNSKIKEYFFFNFKRKNLFDSHVYFFPLLGRSTGLSYKYLLNLSKLKIDSYFSKNFEFYKTKFYISNYKKNKQFFLKTKEKNNFYKSLFKIINYSFPNEVSYLLKKKIKYKKKVSDSIFTVGPHLADGIHKLKIAYEIEQGSKLYLKQIGGAYGTSKNLISEYFDLKICDRFLSWGWHHKNDIKILPSYSNLCDSLKKFTKIKYINKKNILIVGCKLTLLFREFGSRLQPEHVPQYIKRNYSLIRILDKKYKGQVVYKQHAFMGKCLMSENLIKNNLSHTTSNKNFYSLIKNSKLVIHTSNSTTMLETMSLNIPTIMFWEKEEWPIHEYAKPLFEDLKKNNLIFYEKNKLIKFINKNYNNFDKWWKKDKVQKCVLNFNKYFVNTI